MKTTCLMHTRPTSLICFLVSIAILMLAFIPTAPAQAATKKQVNYNGVTFSYDTSLAGSVTAETVPEQIADPNTSGWWESHPEYIKFTFSGFPTSNRYWEPAVYVFPIKSSYQYLNPGQDHDLWRGMMDSTQTIVSQKHKLDPYGYATVSSPIEQVPFLPLINAATPFVGGQQFLSFQNGTGFRCFTAIGQEYEPVTAEYTIYTYQGTSTDGKYYVAATFPAFLSNPPLPFDPASPPDVVAYNRVTIQAIEESSSSQFTPDLNKLDSVIASLTTPASGPSTPGMPITGNPDNPLPTLALLTALLTLTAGILLRKTKQT